MRSILLSASVPHPKRADRFRRVPGAAFEIEQAVISLARAVFAQGGRLVFGGHPSISPLVGIVAGEYRAPKRAEGSGETQPASVVIYQSEAFKGYAREDELLLFKLDLAEIRWIEAVEGESYSPEAPGDRPACPESVLEMRKRMIEECQADAMVCIGGMEGVLEEARLFRETYPHRPIFAVAATGGAAQLLPQEDVQGVVMIDEDIARKLSERHALLPEEERSKRAIPYPLIMQTILKAIVEELRPHPRPRFRSG